MSRKVLSTLMATALLALGGIQTSAGAATIGGINLPVPVPVVASDNVELLATIPDVGAISTAFSATDPYMYVNTLNGVSIYDISDPELPLLTGVLPLPHFENESMSLGERADGTKFVIIGVDIYAVTPEDTDTPVVAKTSNRHLIIVDVTDPAAPFMRGRTDTSSSTHTVQCIPPECIYAYTSGAYQDGFFNVVDLTDLDAPKEIAKLNNVAGQKPASVGGHQWDLDDAGNIWSSGGAGLAAYDISNPLEPKLLASTDANGTKSPYNDFLIHNSYHPNADAFTQTPVLDAEGNQVGLTSGEPSTAAGNVVLATEEDYENPICGGNAGEGTFSTWHIPYLDNDQTLIDNPEEKANRGLITPLDTWNTEILNSGQPTVAGALCSAHYFTYHDAGFIAQGWYQQGTRILDVRDPKNIKQVGYFFAGSSETWHAYWVPERDATGATTGADTNIVYTNDVARGIDVLKVTLPSEAPAETTALTAPILPQWLQGTVKASAATKKFGYFCRLAGITGKTTP